jgi:uncharacterized membrane protein YhiD involved in acid resistance
MNDESPATLDLLWSQLLNAEVQATQPLDVPRVLIAITITFVLAMAIVLVYRLCHRQVVTRAGASTALVLVSMVTTLVIMPISTSIVLSLGMVGALSIVRFRTAMKDPTDIAFLFWGIAVGVCNGAGFFNVSIAGTLVIGVLILIQARVPVQSRDPLLLVVRYSTSAEKAVDAALPPGRLLSKIARSSDVELTLEIPGAQTEHDLPESLVRLDGVHEASLVRYDGSFLSP